MSSLLRRIAVFSARRRKTVIGVWLVVLIGVGFASHALGTQYSSSAEVAGSDSAAANDVMARSFSKELSDASPLVYHTDSGHLEGQANAAAVEASLKAAAAGGERRQPSASSRTRRTARPPPRRCSRRRRSATCRSRRARRSTRPPRSP